MKKILLVFPVLFFFNSKFNAQQKFYVGLKIHPNSTFLANGRGTQLNRKYFKKGIGLIGFNYGLSTSGAIGKMLFDYSTNINTNKIELIFRNFSSDSKHKASLKYTTISFSNTILVGYKIYSNARKYFDIYITNHAQYNILGVFKISGKGNFNNLNVDSYSETIPSINSNIKTFGFGCGLRIRTAIAQFGKFDYGLSYTHLLQTFPSLGFNASINNVNYSGVLNPKIHESSLVFIYHLWSRKKTERKF